MSNPFGIPEISAADVAKRREAGDVFALVDVREVHELDMANLGEGVIHLPLSELINNRLEAVPSEIEDKDQEIVVFCHHGSRSAQVAAFLKGNGWQNVINLEGGIHAYALSVDRSIGTY